MVKNNLFDNIYFAICSIGYSNNNIVLAWLIHFQYYYKKSYLKVEKLLVIDIFGLHLSYKFYYYNQAYKIKFF